MTIKNNTNLNTAILIIYLFKMINILINIITRNKMKKYLNTINYMIKNNQIRNQSYVKKCIKLNIIKIIFIIILMKKICLIKMKLFRYLKNLRK